ncbi:MAG: F0F1 ATP synthase subunit B [Clostridia bacterium]|nr:F0F1 ATP synthase subunit B [Clostridia bacterium]
MAMTNMIAEGGLQILPLDIVQHVLCLLILIFFMTTLVYNPVLNFINKRKESVEATVKENERLSAEVKEIKENADKIVDEARKKAEFISFEATKEAETKSKEILAEAKRKSNDIIEQGKKEIANQKAKLEAEVKAEVGALAIDIAAKVLEREVSEQDNQKVIDECLKGWEN